MEAAPAPPRRRHLSGMWLGEAVPDPAFEAEVATNPIKWSLSLVEGDAVSLFGGGYFDDAGDIPGSPVLFFHLAGQWDPDTGDVQFDKQYDASKVPTELRVGYKGSLTADADGQPVLKGTWQNGSEGTHGLFAARLEEQSAP